MHRKIYYYLTLMLLLTCCRKPYNPSVVSTSNSYLVVEGIVNSGSDSTIIKLSRTVKLNAQNTVNPLPGATVVVESDQSGTWQLVGDGAGNYTSPALNLPSGPNYRIHITTPDGKQYESDYQPVKPTPPIDSIGYTIDSKGLNLYVNAHDPANNTHYYQWEYNEAWIFHAMYESEFVLDSASQTIVPRTNKNQIYYCYANDVSSNLLLSSTAKLAQDVVYRAPLTNIPFNSEKLEVTYLIYLKQYALTGDAYNFYLNVQKTTEQLGSIFDAEPSEVKGNIHNINDASEPVIGWLSVTNAQTKRVYIGGGIVPIGTTVAYPVTCQQDTALYKDKYGYNQVQNTLISNPLTDEPTQPIYAGPVIVGFLYSDLQCTDCTIRGKLSPPWFWK
jgi:hypothetical protein